MSKAAYDAAIGKKLKEGKSAEELFFELALIENGAAGGCRSCTAGPAKRP
jgi:hypothetical protein